MVTQRKMKLQFSKIMNKTTEIINWAGLSRFLAGDRTAVSKNRIPLKYQPKVDRLIELIEHWQNETESSSNGA